VIDVTVISKQEQRIKANNGFWATMVIATVLANGAVISESFLLLVFSIVCVALCYKFNKKEDSIR